jgi:dephospho-CoA kinase
MKLLIIGHKRHGKTTLAEFIKDEIGLDFLDSSVAAAKIFLYDELKEKYNYKSFIECHNDRVNHRQEWFNKISEYNKYDGSRLAKEMLKESDIYVGMRNKRELHTCNENKLFDLIIGIYRPGFELETGSFDIDIFKESDFLIYNNGSLSDLRKKVKRIFNK